MKEYTLKHEFTGEEITITAFSYSIEKYDRVFPMIRGDKTIGELSYPQKNWRIIWIEEIETKDQSTKNSEWERM